jgi:hypothetical protein
MPLSIRASASLADLATFRRHASRDDMEADFIEVDRTDFDADDEL